MKAFFTFCILSINILSGYAQDIFVGNWEMINPDQENTTPLKLSFKIGAPERNILYPAELHLECDSFIATYHLLLAKKNTRQLAIGNTKYPISETPFGIENWTILLNGTLDFSKNIKDNPILSLNRIFTKKFGIPFPDLTSFPKQRILTAKKIQDFFISGRKSSFTVVALAQNYTSIPKVITRNCHYFFILKLNDNTTINNIIRNHNIYDVEKHKFRALYDDATKEPLSFLMVDLRTKNMDEHLRKGFLNFYKLT